MGRAKTVFIIYLIASQALTGVLAGQRAPFVRPRPFYSHVISKLSGGLIRNKQTDPGTGVDRAFSNNSELFVVGGFNGSSLDRVEVLDIEGSAPTPIDIPPHPVKSYGMTVGEFQDVIKTCGGANNAKNCHDYHPADNTWVVSTPMLHERYHHGSSFIEDLWLLSGSAGLTDGFQTTEKWTGSAFEEGPALEHGMHGHCQLTVNTTHIFFAMADGQANYLLDWPNERFTELEPMMYLLSNPSCGLISNARNGREAVVAGFGKSQIFNFESMIWRIGPDPPYFYGAGYTQLSNTFVIVGGRNLSLHFLDSIYMFDNVNYDWIPLNNTLQVAASGVSVTTIPDNLGSPKPRKLPDLAFSNFTKLVVIGGNDDCTTEVKATTSLPLNMLSSQQTQVFDLKDASRHCSPISKIPEENSGMVVGVTQGVIKLCGGTIERSNTCYDYHPGNDSWVQSVSMTKNRTFFGASFIDTVWLLSGGIESGTTTDVWNGFLFESGPRLQNGISGHCQLTLNETHIFFADTHPIGETGYLLNWLDQNMTELPPNPIEMYEPSCGLINNSLKGREAVVAYDGQSQIFNFINLTWRVGPDAPFIITAGSTQLSDTFVIVAGAAGEPSDSIYIFDPSNYVFVKQEHRFEMPICSHAGVVTIPDDFVSCN